MGKRQARIGENKDMAKVKHWAKTGKGYGTIIRTGPTAKKDRGL